MSVRYCHVWVSGRVRGVGYRLATQQHARQLGLVGWVRNVPDGRVEAVFVGEPAAVERMLAWCWQGPPAAVVEDVVVGDVMEAESLGDFEIRA